MKNVALVAAALAFTTCMAPAIAQAAPARNCHAWGTGARTAKVCSGFVDQDGDGHCDNCQAKGGEINRVAATALAMARALDAAMDGAGDNL